MQHKIVYVDGAARCGKSMMCPILAAFDRVEMERMDPSFDWIGTMHMLGKIDQDAAVALIRMWADLLLFDGYLCRNINFRWQDHSSVWRTPNKWSMLKRLFNKEGEHNVQQILDSKLIFQVQTHQQLLSPGIHFQSFPEALHIIEILRHPLHLIDAWWTRNNGTRLAVSYSDIGVSHRYEDTAIHYLCMGWEDEYKEMQPMERIIRILHNYQMKCTETYHSLPRNLQQRILPIRFEEFVTDPWPWIGEMESFLETKASPNIKRVLRHQNVPRVLDQAKRNRILDRVKEQSAPKYQQMVEEMIEDHHRDWRR